MKNKFFKITIITIYLLFFKNSILAQEQFIFDIGKIKIIENGTKFVGENRGIINTNNNITILADEFIYFKNENILNAKGNIEIYDRNNDLKIFTQYLDYKKNEELILTKGITTALVNSKYEFRSKDIYFDRNEMTIISKKKSSILDDELNSYEFENFIYVINNDYLKADNVEIKFKNSTTDKIKEIFFAHGQFNLKNKEFITGDAKYYFDNNIFEKKENDPRIYAVTSKKSGDIVELNKAIFTSCKQNDDCPPWSIQAKKITHNEKKKQIIYDDAIIKIYNKPVLYFPKFFHPDPSVKRQSGFLKPYFNKSHILGSSIQIPYYFNIADNKDLTFKPVFFNNDILMLQNEYRQKNSKSSLITDFSFTDGYKSETTNSKNTISHLFAKFNLDFDLNNFNSSTLDISIQKTNNDTYLKVFDTNLIDSSIKPDNFDNLFSNIEFNFNHEDYNLTSGFSVYENLQQSNNDRYQFILPYYEFSKNLSYFRDYGNLSLNSSGDNNLKNTNNLTSRIINDLNFTSKTFYTNSGLLNNLNLFTKNLNSVGKNDVNYKSSPNLQIVNILEMNTSYPLIKELDNSINTLIPKVSLRFNPSDMKNYNDDERRIDVNNLFDINRLGYTDTLETGKSVTLGLDFKKESLEDINNYFQLKLGTIFRDKLESKIPKRTSINQKSSNLFGSLNYNMNENIEFNYNFALDNNYKNFKENSFSADISLNKFNTKIEFLEENYENNNQNILENSLSYTHDENNIFKFATRRNRELNLTEYYNLVYEYMNDCLSAAIKYKKSYYNDRDLKPSEEIMFTITLFPISSLEQNFNQ